MKRRSILLSITISLVFLIMTGMIAHALLVSIQTWWLVGSNKKLEWRGSTTYQTAMESATSAWCGYKSGIVSKVTISNPRDIDVKDYYEVQGNVGETSQTGMYIRFNTYWMEGYSATRRKNTAMHEIGHALGLGHGIEKTDVMYRTVTDTTTFSANDKASFDYIYTFYP